MADDVLTRLEMMRCFLALQKAIRALAQASPPHATQAVRQSLDAATGELARVMRRIDEDLDGKRSVVPRGQDARAS